MPRLHHWLQQQTYDGSTGCELSPRKLSIFFAIWKSAASPHGLAINWTAKGNPFFNVPTGSVIMGKDVIVVA